MRLTRRTAAFEPVASGAGCHHVLPSVRTAAMARQHVIQRQVAGAAPAILADQSIHRILLSDSNRVLFDERIEIGYRIRDVAITKSCLWLSTDDGKIILIRPIKHLNN